jgi:cytochrome bd-type quinol oxidase subunit 1
MSNTVIYLMIGSVFTMLVDMVSIRYSNTKFNNLERIICIIAWPLTLIAFIWGWFNSKNK